MFWSFSAFKLLISDDIWVSFSVSDNDSIPEISSELLKFTGFEEFERGKDVDGVKVICLSRVAEAC